jgi:hypothetical protein
MVEAADISLHEYISKILDAVVLKKLTLEHGLRDIGMPCHISHYGAKHCNEFV